MSITDTGSTPRTYSVPGISCDHCKHAIESEVGTVAGVERVSVDVATKTVAVVGGHDADVRAAIDEAGYEVA
jgi:copper chaperone CopZ